MKCRHLDSFDRKLNGECFHELDEKNVVQLLICSYAHMSYGDVLID